jgi:Family of unknown function (DUF5681)
MNADDDDESGYGRPPRRNQFQKGQSGNPKGRPRKQREAFIPQLHPTANALRKFGAKQLRLNVNGSETSVLAIEAVAQALYKKALGGGTMAMKNLLAIMMHFDERDAQTRLEPVFKSS